jgi:hypothetical protein
VASAEWSVVVEDRKSSSLVHETRAETDPKSPTLATESYGGLWRGDEFRRTSTVIGIEATHLRWFEVGGPVVDRPSVDEG